MLVFVILIPVIIIFLVLFYNSSKNLNDIFMQYAKRKGLVFNKGFFFLFPSIEKRYDDTVIIISASSSRNSSSTYVKAKAKVSKKINLGIYREYKFLGIKNSFGQDIQIGNSNFDDVYIIKCSDELLIRQVLNADIQQQLLKIKHLNISILYMLGMIQVSSSRILSKQEDMDVFCDAAMLFVERFIDISKRL